MPAPLRARQNRADARAAARNAAPSVNAELPAEPRFATLPPAPLPAFGTAGAAVSPRVGTIAHEVPERPVLPPSPEPFPDAAPVPALPQADRAHPVTLVGLERDDDDAFVGIGTLESAARIRRALSQLAAARAAFGADLGSAHQRRCLTIAANHAAAAERLAHSAESLKAGLA